MASLDVVFLSPVSSSSSEHCGCDGSPADPVEEDRIRVVAAAVPIHPADRQLPRHGDVGGEPARDVLAGQVRRGAPRPINRRSLRRSPGTLARETFRTAAG